MAPSKPLSPSRRSKVADKYGVKVVRLSLYLEMTRRSCHGAMKRALEAIQLDGKLGLDGSSRADAVA